MVRDIKLRLLANTYKMGLNHPICEMVGERR